MPEGRPGRIGDRHRPEIQGLRAIAVLLVVAFHAGLPVPGGFTGVDVFFVISGFVIGGLLLRQLDSRGTIEFGRFYARRVKRLLPALALLVAVTLGISVVVLSPVAGTGEAVRTGLGALLVSANAVLYQLGGYFDGPAARNPFLHTWTLSLEEQFYLVFPAVILVGYRLAGRRGILGVLTVVGCVSFAFGAIPGASAVLGLEKPERFAFYLPVSRAWEFVTGAVLALGSSAFAGLRSRTTLLVGVGGLLGLVAGALVIDERTPFPGTAALLPVVGAAALLIAASSDSLAGTRIAALLAWRPLTWIGDRSYSWYLWHWPFIVFGGLLWPDLPTGPVAAIASLAPAAISFRWMENPIRYNPAIRGRRVAALAAACLALGLVGVAVARTVEVWSPSARAMADQVRPEHLDEILGCTRVLDGNVGTDRCAIDATAGNGVIHLIGDSQAGMLAEGVLGAARSLDRRLTIAAEMGCPPVDAVTYWHELPDPRCTTALDGILARTAAEPGLVVLALSDMYVSDPGHWYADAPGSQPVEDQRGKATIEEAALRRVLERLVASGNRVLVVLVAPHFFIRPGVSDANHWYPADCSGPQTREDSASCGRSRPLAEVEAEQAVVRELTLRAAAAAGAATLDLRPTLCPADLCSTNQGDLWRYRDGTHLTVGESERLAPLFTDALRALLAED